MTLGDCRAVRHGLFMTTPDITYWKKLVDRLNLAGPAPRRRRAAENKEDNVATVGPGRNRRPAAKDKEHKLPAVCPGPVLVHVMGDNGDTFVSPRLLELALCAGWRPNVKRGFVIQLEGQPACAFEVDADSAERLAWTLVSTRTTTEWCCECGVTIGKYWPNCIRGLVRTCASPGLFLVFLNASRPEEA
jgi:hypothetical protein